MARIPYVGEGDNYRKVLNHAPPIAEAISALLKARNESTVAPKVRLLAILAVDHFNGCHRY